MGRIAAILADLALVGVFVIIGRASHSEALDFDGIQRTALPFLAGTLMAWIGFLLKLKGLHALSIRTNRFP